MSLGRRVRLCLKDLYHQDVVEMIERETRKYELESIEHPEHPDFERAYEILWDALRPAGRDGARGGRSGSSCSTTRSSRSPSGTYIRYFLLVARTGDRRRSAACATAACS